MCIRDSATAETDPSGTPAPEAPYTAPVREVTDKDSKEGVKPGSSHKITQSEWLEFRNKDGNLRGTDGKEIFGKDKDHFGKQPRYARLAYGATIFATVSAVLGLIAVSYTHLTLPTIAAECRSRWSPYH